MINKDRVKGAIKQAEGTVKSVVGNVTGNDKLVVEGEIEKVVGKAQSAVGTLKDKIDKNT